MNKNFLILVLFTSLGSYACDYKTKEDFLESGAMSFLRNIPDIVSGESYESFELVNHCAREAQSEDLEEESSNSGFGEYTPLPWRLSLKKSNHYDDKSFYRSLEATVYKEDSCVNHRRMSKALFMHCCMQALKSRLLNKQPFQELIERFKNKVLQEKIDTTYNKAMVYLTKKDISHRLLSYIPVEKNLWNKEQCVVNNKFVRLKYITYFPHEDLEEVCNKKEKWVSRYSSKELRTCDYDFEDDTEHHEKIVKEFELLVQK